MLHHRVGAFISIVTALGFIASFIDKFFPIIAAFAIMLIIVAIVRKVKDLEKRDAYEAEHPGARINRLQAQRDERNKNLRGCLIGLLITVSLCALAVIQFLSRFN